MTSTAAPGQVVDVSLYESVSRYGRIANTAGYPVMVEERYLMSPSPIPKFDNPKLNDSEARFASAISASSPKGRIEWVRPASRTASSTATVRAKGTSGCSA